MLLLVVGLTGGIGSGKSSVAERFAALGVPIIDADLIARELVEPGQVALSRIVEDFGPAVLDDAGRLDRARLRTIIFADAARRRRLEALLHPLILQEMQRRIQACRQPYCILMAPLLMESAPTAGLADRILVVDASPELQTLRTCARDGRAREEVEAVLEAQISREQRLARADDVLANDGPITDLDQQVYELHQLYTQIAERSRGSE